MAVFMLGALWSSALRLLRLSEAIRLEELESGDKSAMAVESMSSVATADVPDFDNTVCPSGRQKCAGRVDNRDYYGRRVRLERSKESGCDGCIVIWPCEFVYT